MAAGEVRAGKAFVEIALRDKLQSGLRAASKRLSNFASSAAAIGAGLAGIGAGMAASFIPAINAASDMQETMSKFDTVFGDSAATVKQWGDAFADEVGRSQQQIAQFMAGSQDLFVPLGFDAATAEQLSKTITGLSLDLASFNNMQDADTLRDLHAALTGSGEVMKKYGVIVSEAAVKQELLNQAIDPKTATEQQKVQARLNIILAGTTAAQGDAIKTAGSYANQMKRLHGTITNVAGTIGAALLPVVTKIVGHVSTAVSAFGKWAASNQHIVATVAAVGAGLGAAGGLMLAIASAAGLAGAAVSGIAVAIPVFTAIGAAIAPVLAPIAAIVAVAWTAAAAWAAAAYAVFRVLDPMQSLVAVAKSLAGLLGAIGSGDFSKIGEAVKAVIFAITRGVIDIVRNTITNLLGLVIGAGEGMSGALGAFGTGAQQIFAEIYSAGKQAMTALALLAMDALSQAPQIVGYAMGVAIRKMAAAVLKMQQWMGQVFAGLVKTLLSVFAQLGPRLITALISGDISGAMAMIGPALQKTLSAQAIAAGGLVAGIAGMDAPEFKLSPETIAAYDKMAQAAKDAQKPPSGAASPGNGLAEVTVTSDEQLPAAADFAAPQSAVEKYRAKLDELRVAFHSSQITAAQFATGLAELRDNVLDTTPLEQYQGRLNMLDEALAGNVITWDEWASASADARAEVFGLASSPIDHFRERIDGLSEALAAGAISQQQFDQALSTERAGFLDLPTDPIDRYQQRVEELQTALRDGLITREQFDLGAMAALPDRVQQIIDETRTPLERYQADLAEIQDLHKRGFLSDETFARKLKQLQAQGSGLGPQLAATNATPTSGTFSSAAAAISAASGGNSVDKQQLKVQEELLKEQRRVAQYSGDMAKALEQAWTMG